MGGEVLLGQRSQHKSDPEGRGKKQVVKGLEPAGPHLCRPPLMRGLFGPKGLGVFTHPLLLGLHSCIVPGCAEGSHHASCWAK